MKSCQKTGKRFGRNTDNATVQQVAVSLKTAAVNRSNRSDRFAEPVKTDLHE